MQKNGRKDSKSLAKNSHHVKKFEKQKGTLKTSSPDLSSNALNYKNPLGYQVDPRTGSLQSTITPPTLSGFFGSMITPTIHYTQQSMGSDMQMLGLPLGWAYHLSFISGSRVFINGQSSYYIDGNYPSGMRYYNLKNVVFKEYGRPKAFPYDNKLSYVNSLNFYTGETQYFDKNGRLIGVDDRFGNHVILYYTTDADIYHSKLSKIVDSFEQEIVFTYTSEAIKITYPKNGMNAVEFSYLIDKNAYLKGYRDPLGRETIIVNKGGNARGNLISKISNPNGLTVFYEYKNLKYYADPSKRNFSNLDVVASVKEVYGDTTKTVTYNYNPKDDEHNFTGYPLYSMGGNTDTLLESYNNEYRYFTRVDDGILIAEHCYNNLHLELETRLFTKDDLKLVNHITNTYKGYTAPH